MKPACFRPLLIGLILMGYAQPVAKADSKAKQAPVLITREFKVPLDFLISTAPDQEKKNPFERKTAQEVLKAWGLPFPEGAAASLNLPNSLLVVRNTQENLELLSSLVDEEAKKAPRRVVVQTTVIEGPGKLIRAVNAATARKKSAGQELEDLLAQAKQADSKVSVVGDAWLETRSGWRSLTETAREHVYASQVNLDAKNRSSLELEMRRIGLRLELETFIGTDSRVISLHPTILDLFPASPQTRPTRVSDPMSGNPADFTVTDVRNISFLTNFALMSGDTKILGIAKPVGKAEADRDDVLWIAFLTIHAMPIEILSMPPVDPTPPPDKNTKPKKHLTDRIPGCGVGEIDFFPKRPLTSFFTLHTVQAPAPFLRALATKAATAGDHAAVWQEIEAAAARGVVSFIDSHVLEGESGVKAEIHASHEWSYPASFKTDAKGRPEITFEMRPVGSRLAVAPVISHDAHSIGVEIDYELHTAPPHLHRHGFLDPGSQLKYEIPQPDFHVAHVQTALTLAHGGTRLISLWKPAGHEGEDILWATFLHGEVMLQTAAEKPAPAGAIGTNIPPPDENEWLSRAFSVPPDIVNGKETATELLKSAGISFPEGAKAWFNVETNKLIVRNQRKHMDMVEAFVDPNPAPYPRTQVFTTHIIQAPGPVIRRLMADVCGHCDHRQQMDQLFDSAEVKHLGTSRIEAGGGVRATAEEVTEHLALASVSADQHGGIAIKEEVRKVGFITSLESVLKTDGRTIALTLSPEFHTAEPEVHREQLTDTQGRKLEFPLAHYHSAQITTSIFIPGGTARLIGVWRPTGKPEFETEDILQAAFITADYLR